MFKTIYVFENWSGDTPVKLGKLYVDQARGSEQYAFEYDEAWLTAGRFVYVLDPDLSLYKGRQYPIDKKTFGIFADSAPDCWGRLLMQRREKLIANKEGRKPKKLLDSDYLLGVYDETRMGAIRFCMFAWKTAARSCLQTEKWPHRRGQDYGTWRKLPDSLKRMKAA